jgi:hypothetical protein
MPSYIKNCVEDGDFSKAKEGDRFRRDLQSELQRQSTILNSRRVSSRNELSVAQVGFPSSADDPIVQDFDRETRERERSLNCAQRRLAAQFEDRWRRKTVGKYLKPSNHLRELRIRQREKEIAGDEEGVGQLREEIEALETKEKESAEEQFWSDYKAAREKLEERLQAEARQFRLSREKLRARLVVRSRGIYIGPIERPAPVISIMAGPSRPGTESSSRGGESHLPPLYDATPWRERRRAEAQKEENNVFVSNVEEGLAEPRPELDRTEVVEEGVAEEGQKDGDEGNEEKAEEE